MKSLNKPICFMVMPFGIKDVAVNNSDVPRKIDFDRLWESAIKPALAYLGYEPVRADQETNSLIIHEMLERLFYADLVVADMTIPNGNVYYEVGVRHAAQQNGCVLISATWATPLFDTQQMRRIVYELPHQSVTDQEAAAVKDALIKGISSLRDGISPVHQALPGYPKPDPDRAITLRQEVMKFAELESEIRMLQFLDPEEQVRKAAAISGRYPPNVPQRYSVVVMVLNMLRDCGEWVKMRAYLESLPTVFQEMPYLQEQRALAMAKSKHPDDVQYAIVLLTALINVQGGTPERWGLIGGRYKELANQARARGDDRARSQAIERAIHAYEEGRKLEFSGYYCTSNLARLYRDRGHSADKAHAQFSHQLTVLMVRSEMERNSTDEWAKPTLLGAAFDNGDFNEAQKIVGEIEREGAAAWKLKTTLSDLERSVTQMAVAEQSKFQALLDKLKELLPHH